MDGVPEDTSNLTIQEKMQAEIDKVSEIHDNAAGPLIPADEAIHVYQTILTKVTGYAYINSQLQNLGKPQKEFIPGVEFTPENNRQIVEMAAKKTLEIAELRSVSEEVRNRIPNLLEGLKEGTNDDIGEKAFGSDWKEWNPFGEK